MKERPDFITEYFLMHGRHYMGKPNISKYVKERQEQSQKRKEKIAELMLEIFDLLKEERR